MENKIEWRAEDFVHAFIADHWYCYQRTGENVMKLTWNYYYKLSVIKLIKFVNTSREWERQREGVRDNFNLRSFQVKVNYCVPSSLMGDHINFNKKPSIEIESELGKRAVVKSYLVFKTQSENLNFRCRNFSTCRKLPTNCRKCPISFWNILTTWWKEWQAA